jgi:subtilisin-like proprotein convertase family protein
VPGTTIGRVADYSIACGTASTNTAADAIYYINVPNGQQLNIRQASNSYDSQHYVRYGGTCPGNTFIACVDDDGGEVAWVSWVNTTGSTQRVWWIQDGYGGNTGNFELEWNIDACPTPTASVATNVLSNSASANFSAFAGNYVVEYGPSATFTTPGTGVAPGPNGTVETTGASPFVINGLIPNTSYRYFVRRDCGGGSYSANSAGITFTTQSGVAVSNGTCGLNHPIPDNGCGSNNSLNALIAVSGIPSTLGMNSVLESVDLILAHNSRQHMQVRLVSPDGQVRNMILQRGGNGNNFGNPSACPGSILKLRDGGTNLTSMSTSTNDITGTFAPEQSLSGYTGNANGTWTLTICDATIFTSGSLRYVKLNFAPLDCQGVMNGTAIPGSPCNDGNACTVNDVYDVSCGCAGTVLDSDNDGTCDANDGCPNDPNKVATGACGCGVADVAATYYADTDGDGFGDPSAPQAGFTCTTPVGFVSNSSDHCPSDPAKQDPGICGCGVADVATTYYADADGDGSGDPGSTLAGFTLVLYADADGDGFGAGSPTACGVSNNADDCPNVTGLIGSNCDALAGPGFVLGQLSGACVCEAIPCTENVTVDLRTDANSNEAGWEIMDQNSSLVLCSGGYPESPYPSNITNPIAESCCLPVGCYRLRVLDSAGDGFTSGGFTGGYQLRESGPNGRRIIDNFEHFATGSVSTIGGTNDNGAFCVPLGDVELIFSSCDKLDWVSNQYLVCHADANVSAEWIPNGANSVQDNNSGYNFWIFDPNGTYSFRRFRTHHASDGFSPATATRAAHLKINGWAHTALTPHIPEGKLMNVRVRPIHNWNVGAWGPACTMKLDAVRATYPLVNLQDDPANPSDYSCGVTRNFGGSNSNANKIVADPPQFQPAPLAGGTGLRYQFRFRLPAENVCIVRPPQTSPTLYLNWHINTGAQLQASKTYEVEVRVSKDQGATWAVDSSNPACDPSPVTTWGKTCSVTIGTVVTLDGESSSIATQGNGTFTMYPNPNRGDRLFISLTEVETDVNTVSVDIYDMTGKRVIARTIAVQDDRINTALDLSGSLTGGVYLVNMTVGTKTRTERLVIQP